MTKAEYDPPMSKPAAALGLLAVMAGSWYWALTPASPTPGPRRSSGPTPAAARASQVPAVRLDALGTRGQQQPTAGAGRNPFGTAAPESGARTPSQSASRVRPIAATAADPAHAPPQWPRLELIGLAEAREGSGLVRTAILSVPQGVLHARPGDVLADVYRLERIGVDAVEVRLLPEDRVVRLPLRR